MSSWRDEPDPDCPECGGPVSPTSPYCMHCGADFGDLDEDADVSDADDWPREGRTSASRGGFLDRLGKYLGGRGRESPGRESTEPERERETERRGRTDDRPGRGGKGGADAGEAALWARAITAFVVSIPVTLLAFFILLALLERLSGSAGSILLLAIWGGTLAYLVRKPLPSDIIGDAFYAFAALLLLGPVLGYAIMIARALVTSATLEDGFGILVTQLLIIEFTLVWPAAVLAGIGYVFNWWAAKKLGSAADAD